MADKLRPGHYLSKNTRLYWPRYVTFYDVESDLAKDPRGRQFFTPFLWVACHTQWRNDYRELLTEWQHGQEIDPFWDELEKISYEKTTRYVVSHHVEPDFVPMEGIPQLMKRGWTLGHCYKKRLTMIMRWSKGKKKLLFMNNAQILPGTIKRWGELLEIPKGTMPENRADLDSWITYCKRDVEIMIKAWISLKGFIQEHDLGGFAITTAGMAMHAFKHRFVNQKVWIHNNPETLKLEREAYHGGRCQALQHGIHESGTYYTLDVNGMYAQVEINCTLPVSLCGFYDSRGVSELQHSLQKYAAVALVDLDAHDPVYAVLLGDKLEYPQGEITAALTTPELLYAFDRDEITHVHCCALYRQGLLMKEYGEFFSQLKAKYTADKNWLMRQLCKDFPNMLYGKFGQKGSKSTIIGDCDPEIFRYMDGYDTINNERFDLLMAGGKVKKIVETPAAWDTFVAIAAHVTAYARMYLWELMQKAGLENVYHVATDSLVVNQEGYNRLAPLLDPVRVGALKVEETGNRLIVYGKNDWQLAGKRHLKGVQEKAEWIGPNTAVNTNWPGLENWLKGTYKGQYFTEPVTKTLERKEYHEWQSKSGGEKSSSSAST